MKENVEFEINENNRTGLICTEKGKYFCDMHQEVEKFIQTGERFPQCDQKNIPHDTLWNKIIKNI